MRYYPGDSEPLVLFKEETRDKFGHLSVYYINGTIEVIDYFYGLIPV
jgi:hypothetical protein